MQKLDTDSRPQIAALLWLYTGIVLLFTIASWSVYLWGGAAYARPLFMGADQFKDLTNYIGKMAYLRDSSAALGRGLPIFTYPAPAAFVYKFLLETFRGHAVRGSLTLLGVCVTCFAFVVWRASKPSRRNRAATVAAILTAAYLGSPLWFTADRANLEGAVWVLVAAGVCLVLRGKGLLGAILIGLAASIKPFSILYLLLLLKRRQYREAACGVAALAAVTLAALTWLGPNPYKAYRNLQPGVSLYVARYVTNVVPYEEGRFDHSILDGMKSAALIVKVREVRSDTMDLKLEALRGEPGGWHVARLLVSVYPLIAVTAFVLLLAIFSRLPMLNQMSALAVATTLLPLSASEYTLLQMYVPFGALIIFLVREVAAGKAEIAWTSARRLVVVYALLFAPLSIFSIFAGDVKLVVLLVLLGTLARTPLHSAYFEIDPSASVHSPSAVEAS